MQRRPISLRLRFSVLKADGFRCHYCGRKASETRLQVDHIVPVALGGTNDPYNLVAACGSCNHRKGGRLPEEAGMRLRRPPHEPYCDIYAMYSSYLADPRNVAWRDYLTLNR